MAKKKKHLSNPVKSSPEKYIRERVRQLPIGKCYMDRAWQDYQETNVIITRCHKDGRITAGIYLVDAACTGVKDTFYLFASEPSNIYDLVKLFQDIHYDFGEVKYEEAHNFILGAIEFAEEGGIKPHRDFAITQYILKEDTDDIPLIEYEYGRDGKHVLYVSDENELRKYLPSLRSALGDNFEYYIDDDEYMDDEYMDDEYMNDDEMEMLRQHYNPEGRLFEEEYVRPVSLYPMSLSLKHSEIRRHFLYPEYGVIDDKVRDEILALPHDELKSDLEQLLYFYCGIKGSMLDHKDRTVLNCLYLLQDVGDAQSLDTVLETLRQPEEWFKAIGSLAADVYAPLFYNIASDQLDVLTAFMQEVGRFSQARSMVMIGVMMIYQYCPERQTEITEWWRDLLRYFLTALPTHKGCDSFTAALAINHIVINGLKGLDDEINQLFDTKMVPNMVAEINKMLEQYMTDDEDEYDE